MRNPRHELVEAAYEGDLMLLREHGWAPVLDALANWWPGRFEPRDLAPYCDALGDEKLADIISAIRDLRTAQFRPKPNEIYRAMAESTASLPRDESRDRYGQRLRKDQMSPALIKVRMLQDSGHHTCTCEPRPVTLKIDKFSVLTCPSCGGLEQGQVYAAEDDLDF